MNIICVGVCCMCVLVCVGECICVYICVCIGVYIYLYGCMCVSVCLGVSMCSCVYIFVCVCLYVHVKMCLCVAVCFMNIITTGRVAALWEHFGHDVGAVRAQLGACTSLLPHLEDVDWQLHHTVTVRGGEGVLISHTIKIKV